MGQKYIIDTNILIYNLKNDFPAEVTNTIDEIFNESFNISIISEIEFLGWQNFSLELKKDARKFLKLAFILPLDFSIKEKAIELKLSYNIKLADAIIAATAIVHEYTLVTRNVRDFDKIAGLNLYNPFE